MHHVRLAVADDLPTILEISNWAALHTAANFAIEPESFDSWSRSFLDTSERYPWLVADTGGAVIGFAKASPWKGRCAYHWAAETTVYVQPDAHGRGIGRALYVRLIDLLDRQGYRTLLGGITLPNVASVALHESCGFRHVATFERVGWKFDRWHDVGYWERLLGASDETPRAIRPVREVAGAASLS
ncbi:MAG: N-acetyltransferase [Phycisphaerales bacterium]|nr:N-acetyltransferase [Phycisphaerales bacterium]